MFGSSSGWLHLDGELDSTSAPQLERELDFALARVRTVVLDIRTLRFIDSAGLRVILRACEHGTAIGANLVVIRSPDQVHPVFEVADVRSALLTVEAGELVSERAAAKHT